MIETMLPPPPVGALGQHVLRVVQGPRYSLGAVPSSMPSNQSGLGPVEVLEVSQEQDLTVNRLDCVECFLDAQRIDSTCTSACERDVWRPSHRPATAAEFAIGIS